MKGDQKVFPFRISILYVGILFVVILCCGGCSKSTGILGSVFSGNSLDEMESMEKLTKYVQDNISEGKKEITFKTESLSLAEIQKINEDLDGYYGSVNQCESRKIFLSSFTEVTLYCDISDNYYVEKSILEKKTIPSDAKMAGKLKDLCESLLDKMNEEIGDDASDYKKEIWIHDYLVSHTEYGYPDGENENSTEGTAHESYGALASHKAVCNGYAFAMKLLCDLSDVPCKVIVGTGDGESHAWNLVQLDDDWYHVDVTWDDPSPDQKSRIIYTYFNIDDERASLGHEWEEDNYPSADSLTYNYYIKNGLYCEDYNEFREKCISILEKGEDDSFQLMVGDYDGSIYSDQNMDFLFEYSDAVSINYQNIGEIPYKTLYITLE